MKISVCMIVRNEVAILAKAIESTKGLADEVIVVDTGSTDGTIELARYLGCVVSTDGDRMHKGQSRNQAIEAASGDWVVILDADEKIADPVGLRVYLEAMMASMVYAVYIRLAFMDANDEPTLSYQQMRCWRKGTYRYKYRAHEVPVPVDGWGDVAHTEFIWEHRPPRDHAEWKMQYTLDRLLLDVEENPRAARPLYYLGRQHMYSKEYKLAIGTLNQYLALEGKQDRADAHNCVSICHGALGNQKEQIAALFRACADNPMRREWYGGLATIYHNLGKNDLAAGLLKCALEIPMPPRSYVKHVWYGAHIHDLLARCLWKLQRYTEGCEHAARAVELDPDNKRLQGNLQWFVDKKAKGSEYYDSVWLQIASRPEQMENIRSLACKASKFAEGSVLDLGCGTGELVEFLNGSDYTGVDFSYRAIEIARLSHPGKRFICDDFLGYDLGAYIARVNTIVMLEVLEHLDDPVAACELAKRLADKRIVISVPVNMPDPAHIKPQWNMADIEGLLGNLSHCEQIMNGRYWLAVKEI